jgi:hypothetical protein
MIDRLKSDNSQLASVDRSSRLEVSKLTDIVRELQACIKLMIEAADITANRLSTYTFT